MPAAAPADGAALALVEDLAVPVAVPEVVAVTVFVTVPVPVVVALIVPVVMVEFEIADVATTEAKFTYFITCSKTQLAKVHR